MHGMSNMKLIETCSINNKLIRKDRQTDRQTGRQAGTAFWNCWDEHLTKKLHRCNRTFPHEMAGKRLGIRDAAKWHFDCSGGRHGGWGGVGEFNLHDVTSQPISSTVTIQLLWLQDGECLKIANAISIANGRKLDGNKFLNVLLQKRHAFDVRNSSVSISGRAINYIWPETRNK